VKWILNIDWIKFDVLKYRGAMRKYLSEYSKEAGKAWLRAAVDETPIPTWSGASRGTFQKLARELGTSVPIGPIKSRVNRTALGRSVSTGSGVEEDRGREYYGFTYETDLRYLKYNEYNRAVPVNPWKEPHPYWTAIKNTPYGFQNRALLAWKGFAKRVHLPDPMERKFVRKFRI